MDADELLSIYGGNDKQSKQSFDADELLRQYGGSGKDAATKKPSSNDNVEIRIREPKPPISGFTKEQSDIINSKPSKAGGKDTPEPFPLSPTVVIPNIGSDIANSFSEGTRSFSGGLSDLVNKGDLAGLKKMGLGGLQTITSIPAGIAQGGVETPVTELTGNPDIGSRAGFVASSAIPIAPGLGVVNKLRPSNAAFRDIISDITNQGANPENLVSVVKEMKANPRLGPVDLSPAVQSATQHLFTVDDAGTKNYLAKTSADRMASSKDAVTAAYDAHTGLPVNAVNKLKDLSDAAKKVGNEQIQPALKSAGPVDVSNTINSIDQILKPGVMTKITGESSLPLAGVKKELANIKQYLGNDKEMRTSATDLHSFQSGLRRTGESLLKSADGGSRELGKALLNVRNNLVSDIDKATGGKYKPALANFRGEKEISDAFMNGYGNVFSNSKKLENLPEFTEKWVNSLTPEEKEAAKEGARTAIRMQMGQARNAALAGINFAKSDFNKEKLALLMGKDEASSLIKELEAEAKIANSHNKIFEGSQTAQRISANTARDLPKPTEPNSIGRLATLVSYIAPEAANFYGTGYAVPGLGLAASLASHGVSTGIRKSKDAVKLALAKEGNANYAKMALPVQGPERDALISAMEKAIPGPKQSLVSKAIPLARIVAP